MVAVIACLGLSLPALANSPHAGVYIGNVSDASTMAHTGYFTMLVQSNGLATAIFYDLGSADGASAEDFTVRADGSFAFDLPHRNADEMQPGQKVVGLFALGIVSGNICSYTLDSGDPACPGSGGNNPLTNTFFALRSAQRGEFGRFGGLYTGTMTGSGTESGLPATADGPIVLIADAMGNTMLLASPRLTIANDPQGIIDVTGQAQLDPMSAQLSYTISGGGAITGNLYYAAEPLRADGNWSIFNANRSLSGTWNMERVAGVPDALPSLVSMADANGNNSTDFGLALRDPVNSKINVYVVDGGNGDIIEMRGFGSTPALGTASVSDANGDLVPEFGVLADGSLFALVKDVLSNTQIGRPKFSTNYDPLAFLALGEAGGGAGPDVASVGRNPNTGKVQAQVKDVASGDLVKRIGFKKAFLPFGAVALDNVGDSPAMDIAVLGINAKGRVQAQVKDAASGNLISSIVFNKRFFPLFFAAVHDANGDLTNVAVLGLNISGVFKAQVFSASDGTPVNDVKFSKRYYPVAFFSFADSNASGGGEIGVVGIKSNGAVRAQVLEIADGAKVKTMTFNKNYMTLAAIAVNGAAGTGRNEIVVLGETASGNYRLQVKDLLSGEQVGNYKVP